MPLNLADLEPILDQLLESTAWGDVVPFSDYPNNDWQDYSTYGQAFTTIDDRQDGRNWPIYRNEQELARIRAQVRRFISMSELTEAITTALKVYTFGKGITVEVQPESNVNCPPELVGNVKRIIDRFCEENSFVNNFDFEIHKRSIDDGEVQIPIERDPCKPRSIIVEFAEADQLTTPRSANQDDFVNWIADKHNIDCGAFVPSWSFGVLTDARRTARPLGYHICYDSGGTDWDFYSAEEFVHIKKNVTRAMKRGLSDWFAIKDRIAQSAKLMKNMAHGAALQSAIAWIEESPAGTTLDKLGGISPTDSVYQKPTNLGNGGGTRTQKQTNYSAGSILRPTPGRQYKAGPMGAERNQGFQVIEEMVERLAGTRFSMPYYIISGDASNGNFSSTLVAESPFVKARECDQQFYGGAFESLLWKVVMLAWKLGWLDLRGIPVYSLRKMVTIKVTFPEVATRDRSALVSQLVQEVTILGVTSARTAATVLGRDYDEELKNGAKPDSTTINPPGTEPPKDPNQPSQTPPQEGGSTGELANASTLQFRRNVKAINQILTTFKSGESTRPHAKQLLLSVGMQDARAEALLDDASDPNGTDTQTSSAIESVKILESTLMEHDVSGENRDHGKFATGAGSGARAKKPKAGSSGFHDVELNASGKHQLVGGGALPAHIKKAIPKAWTDIKVADDPNSPLQVIGRDAKGRSQSRYSDAHTATHTANNFDKTVKLLDQHESLGALHAANSATSDEGKVMTLIHSMGLRPGSEKDTGAKKQAYGATTLRGEHVVTENGQMRLKFVGKDGVNLDLPVTDPAMVKMLSDQKAKSGDGKLFHTSNVKLLKYAHDNGGFTPKNYRTALGTKTARELVAKMPKPTNEKAATAAEKQVGALVSKVLGNTPAIALQKYIDPRTFSA